MGEREVFTTSNFYITQTRCEKNNFQGGYIGCWIRKSFTVGEGGRFTGERRDEFEFFPRDCEDLTSKFYLIGS